MLPNRHPRTVYASTLPETCVFRCILLDHTAFFLRNQPTLPLFICDAMVKWALRKHAYPPDMHEVAVNMVIDQAERLVW